jgi:hypothetical protein
MSCNRVPKQRDKDSRDRHSQSSDQHHDLFEAHEPAYQNHMMSPEQPIPTPLVTPTSGASRPCQSRE